MDYSFRTEVHLERGECAVYFGSVEPSRFDVLKIGSGSGAAVFVPFPCEGITNVRIFASRDCTIAVRSGTKIEKASRTRAAIARLAAAAFRSVILPFEGGELLFETEGGAARKRLAKELKILSLLGLDPQAFPPERSEEMAFGLKADMKSHTQAVLRLGATVHLHYPDAWADIEAALSRLADPFGLIVTATSEAAPVLPRVAERFSFADIRTVPNVGRDVRPFLALLDEGAFDGFDVVCKVHGKKSLREGRATLLGDLWRRAALIDLLARPDLETSILLRFATDPGLGILGPARFRLTNAGFSLHDAWSGNRDTTISLAAAVGIETQDFALDFFAGTMFWFRPAALSVLRDKGLSKPDAYAVEAGKIDGAMEHALERLFTVAAHTAGYAAGSTSSTPQLHTASRV